MGGCISIFLSVTCNSAIGLLYFLEPFFPTGPATISSSAATPVASDLQSPLHRICIRCLLILGFAIHTYHPLFIWNNCQRIAKPYNKLPRIANPRQREHPQERSSYFLTGYFTSENKGVKPHLFRAIYPFGFMYYVDHLLFP